MGEEASVAVAVIRSQEDAQVAHRVDDEHEEEHGRAREANAVVGHGKVRLRHDGEEDVLHEAQHHVAQGAEPQLAHALHSKELQNRFVTKPGTVQPRNAWSMMSSKR